MSLHSSFTSGRKTGRHKNVLPKAERLSKLEAAGKWSPENGSVYGLPKVGNRKVLGGKKKATPKVAAGAAGAAPAPA